MRRSSKATSQDPASDNDDCKRLFRDAIEKRQMSLATLKAAQRVVGKLLAISSIWPLILWWMPFLNRELGKAVKAWPSQVLLPEAKQLKVVVFSLQSRRDLQ